MGTKRKFWYRAPGTNGPDWLFKHPRENTGEHWAEKISAEVAKALGISHARVELAEIEAEAAPSARGSTSESFLNDEDVLIHGNEIMAHLLSGYHRDLTFDQTLHTFENIMVGLDILFRDMPDRRQSAIGFASTWFWMRWWETPTGTMKTGGCC